MNPKIKILYIDDEEINIMMFKINFSKKYEVFTGLSGNDGLALLAENQDIRIVISDMKMPNMNGIEFITKAKGLYADKKYFILTGFDITKEIQHALETKLILKYFRKPFNMKEIEAAINEIIY